MNTKNMDFFGTPPECAEEVACTVDDMALFCRRFLNANSESDQIQAAYQLDVLSKLYIAKYPLYRRLIGAPPERSN